MKTRSFKKVITLILMVTIISSTALFTSIISNAFVPTRPYTLSGLRYEGEYKSYVLNGYVINLGYDMSYVFQAYGNDYQTCEWNDDYGNVVGYDYRFPDATIISCRVTDRVTRISAHNPNFKYTVYDPQTYTYNYIQIGVSDKIAVRNIYGFENWDSGNSGFDYDRFIFGDTCVSVHYSGDIVSYFVIEDLDPDN